MSGKYRWFVFIIFAVTLTVGSQVSAQMKPGGQEAPAEKAEKEEKVQTGVIASFGNYQQKASIDSASSTEAAGDEPNAIGGSVNRVSSSECEAVVKNMSKSNKYSVRFNVEGTTASGSKIAGRSFSATIPPQGQTTRKVRCKKGANMSIVLRSARKM